MPFVENPRIGCVGCGHMGGAILQGLAERSPYILHAFNRTQERVRPLMTKGVKCMGDLASLVHSSDVIIVALKPYLVESTLRQIRPCLNKDKLVVSVAAGITLRVLRNAVEGVCPVVRSMPNTPALVGAGVFALCFDDTGLTEAHKTCLKNIFTYIGMPLEMSEKKMTAFSALVGAGPAYVYHFMDALVQAGVTMGFTNTEAKNMVQALLYGSVHMAATSEDSLIDMRNQVCSPAGITIEAINHMERTALRGHIIDAILAADKKGRAMEDEQKLSSFYDS